ncbi:hypothetical protein J6TS7_09740 [Paenibacillus dendritiformis]|nr:hypothetical protein J6TS7_09740 [Paenibacillus dendritiformis]
MDMRHHRGRLKQLGLARAGSGPAHIDAAYRALLRHDYRAACQRSLVLRMAEPNARHIRDAAGIWQRLLRFMMSVLYVMYELPLPPVEMILSIASL